MEIDDIRKEMLTVDPNNELDIKRLELLLDIEDHIREQHRCTYHYAGYKCGKDDVVVCVDGDWSKCPLDEVETAKVKTFCKDCLYAVRTEDGEYNPEDIVCSYWQSDGLNEHDYCSRAKEGIYKPEKDEEE